MDRSSTDASGAEALLALNRLLSPEEPVDAVLRAVLDAACSDVPGIDLGSVTLLRERKPKTVVSTHPDADAADEAQYRSGEGPCLQALSDQVTCIVDLENESRWPDFVASGLDHDLRSSLSLPLIVGKQGAGALNLYARKARAISEASEVFGRALATQASTAVANSLLLLEAHEALDQLREALASRDVIGQAKGILMAQRRMTADQAFEQLVAPSQRRNLKVRDLAEHVAATGSLD